VAYSFGPPCRPIVRHAKIIVTAVYLPWDPQSRSQRYSLPWCTYALYIYNWWPRSRFSWLAINKSSKPLLHCAGRCVQSATCSCCREIILVETWYGRDRDLSQTRVSADLLQFVSFWVIFTVNYLVALGVGIIRVCCIGVSLIHILWACSVRYVITYTPSDSNVC